MDFSLENGFLHSYFETSNPTKMGSSNSKVECLIKPAQSGKTRTIQDKIRYYELIVDAFGRGSALNIVICSNNRQLVEQTTARMTSDLFDTGSVTSDDYDGNDAISGSCFSWTSGTKKNNVSVGHLANEIKEGRVSMVVCCAHKKRLAYLYNLLTDLNNSRLFDGNVNLWIDEADESISLWGNPMFDVTRFAKVESVTLVSATFNSVIKKYGRIKVMPLTVTHPETYHTIEECNLIEDCSVGNSVEYLKSIFSKYETTLKKPGMRLFAPGDVEIATHDAIAEFLGQNGFAVMVLNGKRKCIIVPGRADPIDINAQVDDDTPEEIGKVMARIYHNNNLAAFPFAITGQLCLGRGLTFQTETFMFDFGIMSNIGNDATAYQCVSRMIGNIKNYPGYTPATIVTTTRMKSAVLRQEKIAIRLARMVYDNRLPDVGEEEIHVAAGGDLEEFRIRAEDKKKRHLFDVRLNKSAKFEEFSSMEALRLRWKEIYPEGETPGRGMKYDSDGKFKCSIGKTSSVQDTDVLRQWLTKSGVASWGSALTQLMDKENDERKGKMLASIKVGYKGDTPTFFLRYLTMPDFEEPEHPFDA